MKILVILALRNEIAYIERCLRHLSLNDVDVFVFDNDSTDGTSEVCQNSELENIVGYQNIPFKGYFDLTEQLEFKHELRKKVDYDWIIHLDADEMIYSDIRGESIRDAISRVDSLGFDSINFNEIVFVPENDVVNYEALPFDYLMTSYYYFHPNERHRVIAFKNSLKVSNVGNAGHKLEGEEYDLYPHNMSMFHYIALSKDQIIRKYNKRRYNEEELRKGWFHNRVRDWEKIEWAPEGLFKKYNHNSGHLDLTQPLKHHFWDW